MKMKRILAVHRYFYPDSSPYGKILYEMVKKWRSDENVVDVVSSMPSYISADDAERLDVKSKEVTSSGTILRLGLIREKNRGGMVRLINALILFVFLFKTILFNKRYDYVLASTTPPVLLAFFISLCSKVFRYKFIYHYMDIHPEIGLTAGQYKNRLVYKLLKKMDTFAARNAYRCVVLSGDMKASLVGRDSRLDPEKVYVINNFGVGARTILDRKIIDYKEGYLNVIYAGNIGRFQALDILIDALNLLPESTRVFIHIVGEGTERRKLEQVCKDCGQKNIKFYGHVPSEDAQLAISQADIAFLSVSNSVLKFAFPSKLSSYLIQDTPVIAAVETSSELAKLLSDKAVGVAVEVNSTKIAAKFNDLFNDKETLNNWKSNLQILSQDLFGLETFFLKWEQVCQAEELS